MKIRVLGAVNLFDSHYITTEMRLRRATKLESIAKKYLPPGEFRICVLEDYSKVECGSWIPNFGRICLVDRNYDVAICRWKEKFQMKKLIAFCLPALAACGAEPSTSETVDEVEQAVCPASLTCPYDAAFPIFLYAINVQTQPDGSPGPINCVRRNAQWQTKQYSLMKPAGCTTCCAAGYCPDPRYNQLTYSGAWTCSAT